MLGSADLVLAASRTHADDLARARLPRCRGRDPPAGLEHLPNGFEPARTRADRDQLPRPIVDPPDGTFALVFAGTLSQMPDADVFLEALHDLLARRPEARAPPAGAARRALRAEPRRPRGSRWA